MDSGHWTSQIICSQHPVLYSTSMYRKNGTDDTYMKILLRSSSERIV